MAHADESRDFAGKLIFRTIGATFLTLSLVANPLVLRPRFWNMEVAARSIAIDATLIAVGAGLILLRRWAAIVALVVVGYLAVAFGGSVGAVMALLFLILLFSAVLCWRSMQWGNWARDPLVWLAAALIGFLMYGAAAFLRPR